MRLQIAGGSGEEVREQWTGGSELYNNRSRRGEVVVPRAEVEDVAR